MLCSDLLQSKICSKTAVKLLHGDIDQCNRIEPPKEKFQKKWTDTIIINSENSTEEDEGVTSFIIKMKHS